MKNPDAIVIGAGVVGACCALSLTNAGLKVLIIDRGPVTAQRIIDYRTKVGRINAVDELKKISGLGGAKFEEIKALLRVL